jgi:hypothetical protein
MRHVLMVTGAVVLMLAGAVNGIALTIVDLDHEHAH